MMIYEIRTYRFHPGKMAAWMEVYERHGHPVLVGHVGEPLCSGVSEAGQLNEFVQVFQYASFDDRDRRRSAMLADPLFRDYMKRSAPLEAMQSQHNQILRPAFGAPVTTPPVPAS